MLILQQTNVFCLRGPSDVTDILRALLWPPPDESNGREHTLTLKLCQSHAVVNPLEVTLEPPPPQPQEFSIFHVNDIPPEVSDQSEVAPKSTS